MSYYTRMNSLNEGEQAKAYLKRKQDEYDERKNSDEDKYYYDNRRNRTDYYEMEARSNADPSMRTARKIKKYRDEYPNAVPRSKTKSEINYDKKNNKLEKEYSYADDIARSRGYNDVDDRFGKEKVKDAARRHYRRHLAKNEAGIFSECNFIEFAY